MVKLKHLFFVMLICLGLFISTTFALVPDLREKDCVYYFYGLGCSECENTDNYLFQLNQKYPGVTIHRFETYADQENKILLNNYILFFDIPQKDQKLPLVFIGKSYLTGESSIRNLLEGRIKNNNGSECPALTGNNLGISGEGQPVTLMSLETLGRATFSAISDFKEETSLLLLFILLLILTTKYEFKIIYALFYSGGILLAHLLFSWGMFEAFKYSKNSILIARILIIITIVIAAIKMIALFLSWREISKKFSWETKTKFRENLEKYSSILVLFLSGFLLSILSFTQLSNTGQLIRNLYIDGFEPVKMFFLNLYYILIYTLLIVVTIGIYYLLTEKLEKYSEEVMQESSYRSQILHKFYVRILNGIIYLMIIIIGLLVLL